MIPEERSDKDNKEAAESRSGEIKKEPGVAAFIKKHRTVAIVIAALLVLAIGLSVCFTVKKSGRAGYKLLLEWDFSEGQGDFLTDGYYADRSAFSIVPEGPDGSSCAKIVSEGANDARFRVKIDVKPNSYYKVTAKVKTAGVDSPGKAAGANISALYSYDYKGGLVGDNDWTELTVYGLTSSGQTKAEICFRLGFYSCDTSGTAWFDDVKIEQLSKLPSGATAVSFEETMLNNSSGKSSGATTQSQTDLVNQYYDGIKIGLIIVSAAFLFFAVMYRYGVLRDKEKPAGVDGAEKGMRTGAAVIVLLTLGLVLRLVASVTAPQCSIDVNLFSSWGKHIVEDGIPNFYANAASYSLDYPPLYMYFLWFNTLISKWLGLTGTAGHVMLMKLPSILADIGIGWVVYRMASKRVSKNWTIFFIALWVMNPLSMLDSAAWGQVDSILALLCLLMVWFIVKDKFIPASVMLGLAIILKPQGIFMVPIMGYALLRRFFKKKDEPKVRTVLLLLKCLLVCIGTVVVVALPFGIKMEPNFIEWLFNLYVGTANGYKGATVNSYNFYYVIRQNWTPDDGTFLFGMSYFTFGMIMIVVTCIGVWVMYQFTKREDEWLPFLYSSVLVYMVTMFGPRMHERYFFPAAVLLLAAVVYSGNKILLWIYGVLTGVNFMSVLSVMLGLELGGALKNAGATQDLYGKFYWAAQETHRRVIAWINLACCLALLAAAILISINVIKAGDKRLRFGAAEGGAEEGADDGADDRSEDNADEN
jgi:Gpi18-like mannosyltransferase